jgi:endosialidase-like protein
MKKNRMKMTPQLITNSMDRSRLRYGLFLIPFALAAFALSPTTQAQLSPPPDGGYAGDNTAEGTDALFSLTTGTENTALGFDALTSNTTGDSNTATGSIAIESNTTGVRNTANGFAALNSNTIGERNTATGRAAMVNNTTGNNNTADGHDALFSNTTAIRNTATGSFALFSNTTGPDNTAVGYFALFSNTTGDSNTATGYDALLNNTTGAGNIALGNFAGSNLTTGDNNIDIGNQGVAGEANTVRIGTQVTQTATYIAGISGVGVQGVAVKVNAAGKLGVGVSSQRFKEAIKPMERASEAILGLKPVTFHYKKELDPEGALQFGLVAEDVEKVNPDLVVRDKEGKPYTVRYDAVNAMLLNEFLKEHRKVQRLEAALAAMDERLKEQDTKIERINDKVELSKPAPQTVLNNR